MILELHCPNCGSGDLGEADHILATARGRWIIEDGERQFDPLGDTEVHWDTQTPDEEKPVFCHGCDSDLTVEELLTPDAVEAKRERGELVKTHAERLHEAMTEG
jgi:hypothetical protein